MYNTVTPITLEDVRGTIRTYDWRFANNWFSSSACAFFGTVYTGDAWKATNSVGDVMLVFITSELFDHGYPRGYTIRVCFPENPMGMHIRTLTEIGHMSPFSYSDTEEQHAAKNQVRTHARKLLDAFAGDNLPFCAEIDAMLDAACITDEMLGIS